MRSNRSQSSARTGAGTALRVSLAAALVGGSALALSGCKPSDVLTELLVDQDSQNVDEDNVSRFLQNVVDTLNLTEDLPELVRSKTELERERTQEEPVKGDDPVTEEEVPTTVYDETATSVSQVSNQVQGDSENADESRTDGTKKSDGSKKGKGNGKGKGKKKSDGGEGDEGDSTIYHGNGGTGTTYGDDGTYTEVPTGVQTVVAFGECANMVVSFAGEHALAGADADFLENSFIKSAYKDEDIANAKKVSADASGVIDADRVVELAPDALLLSGNEYSLDDAGKSKLKAAKIDVVHLPSTNTASHITKLAESIGKMFGGSDDTLSGEDAKAAAEGYIDWHDSVVKDVESRSGGIVGATNYDTGGDNDGPVGTYTVYAHAWDDCTYYATPDDVKIWTDTRGVAISKVGYKWSPMSYYLSVGGTQNYSATFKKAFYSTSALYYIWQFNLGRVPTVYDKNWGGRSISTEPLKNSGTSDLLVKTSDGQALGSEKFPYIISRTQAITSKLEASRDEGTKKQKGLYGVYGSVVGNKDSGIGFLSATHEYCSAAIVGKYEVVTNPSGLYSSWIDGSPESVLEAVWICDINKGTDTLSSYVTDYYKLFYGVDLTSKQVNTIVSGPKN